MAMTISHLVTLVGFHSIIHGAFGIFFINTSYYVNHKAELNHVYTALYAVLIVFGVLILVSVTFRNPAIIRLLVLFLLVLTIALLGCGIAYLIHYFPFFANCVFDKLLFYTDIECWVCNDHAMSIWHVFAVGLLLLTLLWFLYAYLLCKYAHCVCCLPCPAPACFKQPYLNDPCCQKVKWYQKLTRGTARCANPPCCAPPCPPPPCPPPCTPPCPPSCPPPCPPPCSPCPRKTPKFVLTLRPGRMGCK